MPPAFLFLFIRRAPSNTSLRNFKTLKFRDAGIHRYISALLVLHDRWSPCYRLSKDFVAFISRSIAILCSIAYRSTSNIGINSNTLRVPTAAIARGKNQSRGIHHAHSIALAYPNWRAVLAMHCLCCERGLRRSSGTCSAFESHARRGQLLAGWRG